MMDTISKLIDVFGREGAVRIVNQTPTVMAYSWNTIQDKILFVTEVMGRSIADIVVWPALLTRSVEKRLRPRYGRKIAMLAEREGAEYGEKGGGEEDGGEEGGGEEGGREEDGGEKGREKGGAEKGGREMEGETTGAEVLGEREMTTT
ncbi:unnamed protein product [Closterium sp. Naga37s-1]|nr:unnamed protein product [Closterium sp. Naga37s-1]